MNTRVPIVFVVDDQFSVRKAIERLLRSAGLAVATYASAEAFLAAFDPDQPGCVVLDLSMPGLSGLDVQDALATRGEALPIVFLTGHAEVPDGVQAMKRGAVDFLTKPVDDKTLLDTVRIALERDSLERRRRLLVADIRNRLSTLTPRESEVFHHVISGKLNKQTAFDLGTVEKTIKVHRARIMEKLQVRSVAELVRLAAQAEVGQEEA